MKWQDTFQTFFVKKVHFDIRASVNNVTFELDNVILCPNVDSVQLDSTCKFFILIFLTKAVGSQWNLYNFVSIPAEMSSPSQSQHLGKMWKKTDLVYLKSKLYFCLLLSLLTAGKKFCLLLSSNQKTTFIFSFSEKTNDFPVLIGIWLKSERCLLNVDCPRKLPHVYFILR